MFRSRTLRVSGEPRKSPRTVLKFPKQIVDRSIRRAMRVRSFVCKASNEITTNVSQIAGWTFTEPRGWRVLGHQRYSVTLRYSRNRIDAYDYVDASCFTYERMVGSPALYRVYGFISCRQLRTSILRISGFYVIRFFLRESEEPSVISALS